MDATSTQLSAYQALASSFRRSLLAQNKSPKTIEVYLTGVLAFGEYLAAQGMPLEPGHIRREHVEAYIVHLQTRPHHLTGKPLSANTLATHYKSLRAFFKWLLEEDEIKHSPMERMHPPRVPEDPPAVLSDEELRRLLRACEGKTFKDRRDMAVIRLLIDTGMRRSECGNLRVGDVDWEENAVRVVGKGRKQRLCPFGPKTAQALDRYLRARASYPHHESDALWLGENGPMTPWGIAHVVEVRAGRAGLEGVHPHTFRHTAASRFLSAGGQEHSLMRLAGWTSETMVGRYGASVAAARAREEFRRLKLDEDL